MNEQQQILEMIEKGQITAAEGMELLNALNNIKKEELPAVIAEVTSAKRTQYKYLKIKVMVEKGSINVNVNVPIKLLLTLGDVAGKMNTFIPKEAREEMQNKGIDISNIDFKKIIEEIVDGTLDDPTIVDVDVEDGTEGNIKVKIYVE